MDEQVWAAPDSAADQGPGAFPSSPSRPPSSESNGASTSSATAPTLPVPLRPMTLSDLLDGAFAVIKARPRAVFTIAAVILIPVHVIAAFLQRNLSASVSVTSSFNSIGSGTPTTLRDADLFWAYVGVALVTFALFPLGGAIGRLVTAWYAGGDITAGEALKASFRHLPAMVAAFLLLLIPKFIGGILCGLPALVPVTLFSLTAPAMVVENLGPIAAAQRSWRLIARRFWMSTLVVFTAYIGSSVLNMFMGGVPNALVALLPAPLDWIGAAVVTTAVSMIVTTALVSVSVLMYVDLRIRTEGLDIELGATDAFARAR